MNAKLEHYGRWEGDVFVFDPPITVESEGTTYPMKRLDLTDCEFEEGLTRDDAVWAVIDAHVVRTLTGGGG